MSDIISPSPELDSLDQTKERVMSANNANEIYEHIKQLGNDPKHRQRWIWELLQNAQDVAIDDKVDVQIIFDGSEVTFTHDGQAFTEEDITHLIYHGSSKPGLAGKTGKFGTGFMTTHLLSKKVRVQGSLTDGRFFNFILDREAKDGQDMLRVLDISWNGFKASICTSGTSGLTSFTYLALSDPDISGTVDPVLKAMEDLMPAVMTFSGIIKNVRIDNRGREQLFFVKDQNNEDKVHIQCSSSNQQSVFLIRDLPGHCAKIALPMDVTGRILTIPESTPRLFITFPLVGTDQAFPLPFLIHSQNFEPNKEREKIWIQADTTETVINKGILEAAFSAYYECCSQLTKLPESTDCHLLANLGRLPITDWLDKIWYGEQINRLFTKIDQLPLVLTNHEEFKISLAESLIPYAEEAAFESLWTAWNSLFKSKVPIRRLAPYWKGLIDDRISFSENVIHPAAQTLKDLCKYIDGLQDPELELIPLTGTQPLDFFVYLKNLIEKCDAQALWAEFAVLPNQNSRLRKSGVLQSEEEGEETIGDHLKNIAKGLAVDVREKLVHSIISITATDHQLQPYKKATLVNALLDKVKNSSMAEQSDIFKSSSMLLLKWLLENDKNSSVPSFPVLMRNGKWEKIVLGADPLLAPVLLWPDGFQPFEDIFPSEFILDDAYAIVFSDPILLSKNKAWLLKEPLYYEQSTIKSENIRHLVTKPEDREKLSGIKNGEWTMSGLVKLSQVAYFNRPQDKSVIDKARGSMRRTKRLLEFITGVLLQADELCLIRTEIPLSSDQLTIQVGLVPSLWMRDIKVREWVKSQVSTNSADRPSVESLLPYFNYTENDNELYRSLQQPHVARWLHFLDIGVGDLLRNIRSGDNEEERMNWDQSYVSILMNARLTPEKVTAILGDMDLLQAYENKKRNDELRKRNKEIGTKVEEAFYEAIKMLPGYEINREPIGSDYVIESDDDHYLLIERPDKRTFTIEIKSTTAAHVKMTEKQGEVAKDKQGNYILCVVPLNDEEIDAGYIRRYARFVTDIAVLLDIRVENVIKLKSMKVTAQNNVDDQQVWADIDGMNIRYGIAQSIWALQRPEVFEFCEFVAEKVV